MGTRRHRSEFSPLASLILALLFTTAAVADERRIEIIELDHALASDVLPLLQPLVEPGGSISGTDNKLIVKTTPANLADLLNVLGAIDRPLRRLKITVRQNVDASSLVREHALSGRISSGQASAQIPDPGGRYGASIGYRDKNGNAVRYRALNTRSSNDSQNAHFVTTLEGSPALVQTGQAIPYLYNSGFYGNGIDYRDVTSGFYVTPRLHGDRVTLEIAPQLERANPGDRGTISTRRAHTTLSGRLGEWIPLGGANEAATGSDRELLAQTRRQGSENYNVWVLVEEIP
tara:strand:- start:3239 stop:4105 length:867 start_codon:yes stop_codon:yes gene_type:complete